MPHKILTEVPLNEKMPAGAEVEVPEETYRHMKALEEQGIVIFKDATPENLAVLKASEEAKINEQKEQDKLIEKMAGETLSKQLIEMYGEQGAGVDINISYNEQKEAEKTSCFKSLGENIQMAAALVGCEFPKAQALKEKWYGNQKNYTSFKAITGQSETVDADGGFLVDSFFDRELITRMVETSLMYRDTNLRTVGPGSNGLKWNGRIDYDRQAAGHPVKVFRTAEGGTKQSSVWTIEPFELKLLKIAGLNFLTDELLEDVANLEADVIEWFIEEFGFLNDSELFNGAPATGLTGILDAGTAARIDISRAGQGVGNAATLENILTMYAALHVRSRGTAKWYNNPLNIINLAQMAIGNMPVYMLPGNGASLTPGFASLLGMPIQDIEQAEVIGTAGDLNLWDFNQYRVIQKGTIKVDRSEHVRFIDDETVLRFVMRNNGIPMWSQQMTGANGTDLFSPFISLSDSTA